MDHAREDRAVRVRGTGGLVQRIQSLDSLSDAENERLWTDEALRRDAALDHDPTLARAAEAVFREARARVG